MKLTGKQIAILVEEEFEDNGLTSPQFGMATWFGIWWWKIFSTSVAC